MLIFHFSRFSESIYLQEWLVSFSHLNEVLNAEHVSVGDKYVLADQRNQGECKSNNDSSDFSL